MNANFEISRRSSPPFLSPIAIFERITSDTVSIFSSIREKSFMLFASNNKLVKCHQKIKCDVDCLLHRKFYLLSRILVPTKCFLFNNLADRCSLRVNLADRKTTYGIEDTIPKLFSSRRRPSIVATGKKGREKICLKIPEREYRAHSLSIAFSHVFSRFIFLRLPRASPPSARFVRRVDFYPPLPPPPPIPPSSSFFPSSTYVRLCSAHSR